MTLPEVRISFAWLLSGYASEELNKIWGDGTPLRTDAEYREIADRYQKAWAPYNDKVLQGMCDVYGLEFYQNTIDVHIAPWFHAFSSPMVMGVTFNDHAFVNVLTHELFHRLLTDNTTYNNSMKIVDVWRDLYGEEHSMTTLVHIPVMAGLYYIFLDVLGEPIRLENSIKHNSTAPEYAKAWEYVEKQGYMNVIRKFKHSFSKF